MAIHTITKHVVTSVDVDAEVDVDIDLSDFDDDEIREEAESRGLFDEEEDREFEHIKWEWTYGSRDQAKRLLEIYMRNRGFPGFSL